MNRAVTVLLVAGGTVAFAYEPIPSLDALADAIRIGQSRIERVRADYHHPYRLAVNRPPVDYIDLVTPFRRVELAAEERARQGGRGFGQREALAVLQEQGGRLTVFVELSFHPQNAYVGVPAYVVALARVGSTQRIAADDVHRVPRFGARVAGPPLPYPRAPMLPSGGQPMLGGTLIASFASGKLDPGGVYDVVMEEARKELARTRVDLGKLR